MKRHTLMRFAASYICLSTICNAAELTFVDYQSKSYRLVNEWVNTKNTKKTSSYAPEGCGRYRYINADYDAHFDIGNFFFQVEPMPASYGPLGMYHVAFAPAIPDPMNPRKFATIPGVHKTKTEKWEVGSAEHLNLPGVVASTYKYEKTISDGDFKIPLYYRTTMSGLDSTSFRLDLSYDAYYITESGIPDRNERSCVYKEIVLNDGVFFCDASVWERGQYYHFSWQVRGASDTLNGEQAFRSHIGMISLDIPKRQWRITKKSTEGEAVYDMWVPIGSNPDKLSQSYPVDSRFVQDHTILNIRKTIDGNEVLQCWRMTGGSL